MLVDEAAQVSKKMLEGVILPILKIRGAVLCLISSHQNADNKFHMYMNLKTKAGDLVFKSFNLQMYCQDPRCQKDPTECPHAAGDAPHWIDLEQQAIVNQIMDRRMAAQENAGFVEEISMKFFPQDQCRKMRHNVFPHELTNATTIYVGIDPNAYGNDQWALISYIVLGNSWIIVGIEMSAFKTYAEVSAVYKGHLRKLSLRTDFPGHSMRYVIGPECGGSGAAEIAQMTTDLRIESDISLRVENVELLQHVLRDGSVKVGIVPTNTSNQDMFYKMKGVIRGERLYWADEVTTSTFAGGAEAAKDEFVRQLLNFEQIPIPVTEHSSKSTTTPKYKYSGKGSEPPDDLMFAAGLGIETHDRKYAQFMNTRLG